MSEAESDIWKDITEQHVAQSKAFFDRVARLAWSYSCSILIGCPLKPTQDAKNGTGVFLRMGCEHFVVTAGHIVAWYGEMLERGEHAHFQIGDLTVNPFSRLAYTDATTDIAVIAIAPAEVPAIGSTPYIATDGWPPPPPQIGQQIQFCGYVRINRIDGEAGTIESTVLPLTAEVSNSSDEHFSVHIPRDKYRWAGECLLKPHQAFLGGMSGGPALLLNDPGFPLIGIVCEGSEMFDLVYFRPLSIVPWVQLIA